MNTNATTAALLRPPPIFRRFALSLQTFDYLKEVQRRYAQENPEAHLNNNEVLARILLEHQEFSTKVKNVENNSEYRGAEGPSV